MVTKMFNKFKKAKDGAAVLMVLLVSVFVVFMGSSVLFSSYNGYLVQLVDRQGLDTFYSAEDYLVQARGVVQDFASDSLQTAYTKVMSEYAFLVDQYQSQGEDVVQAAAQEKFTQYFLMELNKLEVKNTNRADSYSKYELDYVDGKYAFDTSDNTKIFQFANGTGQVVPVGFFSSDIKTDGGHLTWEGEYDASLLGKLIGFDDIVADAGANEVIGLASANNTVSGSTTGTFTLTSDVNGDRLTLKDVMISFNEDGYKSYITTDFIIEMPDFVHNGDTNFTTGWDRDIEPYNDGSGFSNSASVGGYWVKVNKSQSTSGNFYGGNLFLYNEATNTSLVEFFHDDGFLVTHGTEITQNKADSDAIYDRDSNDFWDSYVTGTTKGEYTGLDIFDGAVLRTGSNSHVWTRGISIFDGGTAELGGTTYVSGDIFLDAGAVLKVSNLLFVEGDIIVNPGSIVEFDVGVFNEANINPDYCRELYELAKYDDLLDHLMDNLRGCYIGGDLIINSGVSKNEKTSVTMSGGYYGLGDGSGTKFSASGNAYESEVDNYGNQTETIVTYGDANSSIVMNGDNIDLDMTDLSELIISGVTYLNPGRLGAENSEYALGQSMTALPDQVAYLIPAAALSGVSANPSSNPPESVTVDKSYELWPGSGKTIGDYMKETETPIRILYNFSGEGNDLAYYFFDFGINWTENANKYYADYVLYNRETVESNLETFNITMSTSADTQISAAGNVYQFSNDNVSVTQGNSELNDNTLNMLNQLADMFSDLSVSLSGVTASVDNSVNNPYKYYVNEALFVNDADWTIENGTQHVIFCRDEFGYIRARFHTNAASFIGGGKDVPFAEDAFGDKRDLYTGLIVAVNGIDLIADETYYGVAACGVGVANVSPSEKDPDKYALALESTAEIKVVVNGAPITCANGTDLDQYLENTAILALLDERKFEVNFDGTAEAFEENKTNLAGVLTWRALDAWGNPVTDSNLNASTTGFLVMNIPAKAYINDYYGEPGVTEEEDTSISNSGAGETAVKVNWAANDLVYFDNWEKH